MSVKTEIDNRTAALQGVLDNANTALLAKGGDLADNLSGIPSAIGTIPTGGGGDLPVLDTPAAVTDVATGKEFINSNGVKQTGTQPVRNAAALSIYASSGSINVSTQNGIYPVSASTSKPATMLDENLRPANIKNGVSIFDVEGEYLPTLQEKTATANGEITPDTGYDGLSKVTVNVPSGGGGNAVMHTGTFIPVATTDKPIVPHTLGAVPDIWYCEVADADVPPNDSVQRVSRWENVHGNDDAQMIMRMRNGIKYYAGAGIDDATKITPADTTNIYFGGTAANTYSWAAGATYTWVAIKYL